MLIKHNSSLFEAATRAQALAQPVVHWWVKVFSTLLFVALIKLIDWESLLGNPFKDLQIYAYRITQLASTGEAQAYVAHSVVDYITAEYAWMQILRLIAISGIEPFTGLALISALCCAVYYQELSRTIGLWRTAIVLFNPLFIDLVNSQIRIALAFSVLLIIHRIIKISTPLSIITFMLSLIHTAMTIFSFLMFSITFYFKRVRINLHTQIFLIWVSGILFGILLAGTADIIAASISDRRTDTLNNGHSLAYVMFWPIFAIGASWLIWYRRRITMKEMLGLQIVIVGAISTLAGFQGIRLISAAQPLVFAVLRRLGNPDSYLTLTVAAFNIVQFAYWFGVLGR
jgi:hypothetical protein